MTALALAFVAGLLSTFAPCVLPLLPVVLASATEQHRLGPLALATGLALSYTAFGLFIATIGFSIGLDDGFFRLIGGALMLLIGGILLVPAAQLRLAAAASPVQTWTEERFGGFSTSGLKGQFGVGLLLGAVWSPCIGPTLGAATILAAKGQNLGEVALTMLIFGIGAAVPLIVLGTLSRAVLIRWRGRMSEAGGWGKVALGAILVLVGMLILTGLDKGLETWLTLHSPIWLTDLTTRF